MLSTKLFGAQETERKHVAQDLHDSIGGKLTGVKYGLEAIISGLGQELEEVSIQLKDIVAAVHATMEEIQRITKNLHPSVLYDLGLISAVKGYCREFQQFYPAIQIHSQFGLEEQMVPESIKILIYRVLQEAMNNVAKHSEAKNVKIALASIENEIELIVEDDGKGFSLGNISGPTKINSGMGLESMKERTELFGGKLIIEAHIGQGTKIRALWPLST
jgi:signal transduction histidine kinase